MPYDALQKLRAKYPQYNDIPDQELAKRTVIAHPEYTDILGDVAAGAKPPQESAGKRLWEGMNVPSQMAQQGLSKITDLVTPSRADIESGKIGIPGIAARTAGETLSEVAPKFVNRAAILTAMASPVLEGLGAIGGNAAGRWIGNAAEKMSGLAYKTPGVLAETVENPGLPFGPGLDKAREIYQGAKGGVDEIRQGFKEIPTKLDFISGALEAAKDGSLNPQEALEARKALDASKKTLNNVFYSSAREAFDTVAKKAFAGADSAYQAALKSEALRNIWPLNKSGSPSIVKGAIEMVKPGLAPLFSPATQGVIASGVGLAQKAVNNPGTTMAVPSIVDSIKSILAKRKEHK